MFQRCFQITFCVGLLIGSYSIVFAHETIIYKSIDREGNIVYSDTLLAHSIQHKVYHVPLPEKKTLAHRAQSMHSPTVTEHWPLPLQLSIHPKRLALLEHLKTALHILKLDQTTLFALHMLFQHSQQEYIDNPSLNAHDEAVRTLRLHILVDNIRYLQSSVQTQEQHLTHLQQHLKYLHLAENLSESTAERPES